MGMTRRKLHIGGQVFTYIVGNTYVAIWGPDGAKWTPTIAEVTGESWDAIERACWKQYWRGVRPGQVKDYVENRCNGK
jgi:hypothetical protein